MADWRREITRVGELLDLPLLTGGLDAERIARVEAFVDPKLHRNRVRWADLDVPAPVEALAEQAWTDLQPRADPAGDTPEAQARLDEARAAFRTLYAEAEAIAQSSVTAAKAAGRRRGAGKRAAEVAPPASLRVRVARRIPARHRRRLKSAVRSLRRYRR
jgi:hypothetical protein